MCAVYIGRSDDQIHLNPNEIAETRWIGINELTRELAKNGDIYSPWIKLEWERMMLNHRSDIDALFR